jgi:hypothetical protein
MRIALIFGFVLINLSLETVLMTLSSPFFTIGYHVFPEQQHS